MPPGTLRTDLISRILWAGPAVAGDVAITSRFVSPAAVWWNARLVSALAHLGFDAAVSTHIPHPMWPRGPAFVATQPVGAPDQPIASLAYTNMPLVREVSLSASYLRHASTFAGRNTTHIVTYNPYRYLQTMAARFGHPQKRPWVCIYADEVRSSRGRDRWRQAEAHADFHVYLSWADYERMSGCPRAIHLDGGIDVVDEAWEVRQTSRPLVLYTGALGWHGGAELLVDALQYLDRDVEVALCGKDPSPRVLQAVNDPRLKGRLTWHGMVEEERLHALSLQAACFVNPRPNLPSARHNFPSKILRYLGYGRPIASTRTPGLSPDYEDVLTFAESDHPRDIARSIEIAVDSAGDQAARTLRRRFADERTWTSQARRLIELISPPSSI